jgi:hypothetical protein
MKLKTWKIVLASVAILLLLAVLSVVVYWGVIGVTNFDDGMQQLSKLILPKENNVYRKASYSVSDEAAEKKSDQVVATVGDAELSNGLLQIFYWMDVYEYLENYGYYAVYYGLDHTQPLDQQTCKDNEGSTWQQFFLDKALLNWHSYQALIMRAADEGFDLPEEYQSELDNLRATLTEAVLDSDYNSIDEMLQADMGPGCDYEDYYRYMDTYYRGYSYLKDKVDHIEITDEMLNAYFEEHEEELSKDGITKESGDVKDVRHILIAVKGGTTDEEGEVTYSEEEWETCRKEAQKVLDEWLAGEATEESFTDLTYQYSEDTGSNQKGGLYQNLDEESGFVPEFIDWYMDESRKPGDYGLIRTEYGYHVMYFVETEAQWLRHCNQGVVSDLSSEILKETRAQFPMEVQYKKIALGVVDFSQKAE